VASQSAEVVDAKQSGKGTTSVVPQIPQLIPALAAEEPPLDLAYARSRPCVKLYRPYAASPRRVFLSSHQASL
jgi:hypothetical protein